jgi:Double zinc ribbon
VMTSRARPSDEVAPSTTPAAEVPSAVPVHATTEVAPTTMVAAALPVALPVPVPLATTSPERRACPVCETANDADARFCKKCGKNLLDPPASVPA